MMVLSKMLILKKIKTLSFSRKKAKGKGKLSLSYLAFLMRSLNQRTGKFLHLPSSKSPGLKHPHLISSQERWLMFPWSALHRSVLALQPVWMKMVYCIPRRLWQTWCQSSRICFSICLESKTCPGLLSLLPSGPAVLAMSRLGTLWDSFWWWMMELSEVRIHDYRNILKLFFLCFKG